MVKDLVNRLRSLGVHLSVVEGDLRLKFDQASLPEELLTQVRENKAELLNLLSQVHKGDQLHGIPNVQAAESYPLSSAQRRLWLLSQIEYGNTAYNMTGSYLFQGKLDIKKLESAFKILIARHEILRTVFRQDENGDPIQCVRHPETCQFKLVVRDLRDKGLDLAKRMVSKEFIEPFDLVRGPLLRASVNHVSDNEWLLGYVMHHIVSDGWSMTVLVRELMVIYNCEVSGTEPRLGELRIQYKDFSAWQQRQLQLSSMAFHRDYWHRQFSGENSVINIPTDFPRPAVKTYGGQFILMNIDTKFTIKFDKLMKGTDSTLFMGLLSVVYVLLYRYSGQHQITVGTPVAGREHWELENQIGFYVNTLPFKVTIEQEDTFISILAKVKKLTLDGFSHQAYPFDVLVEELKLDQDVSRSPLFDILVVLQNIGSGMQSLTSFADISVAETEVARVTSKYDLTFEFYRNQDGITARIEFNDQLYQRQTIERMGLHLKNILEAFVNGSRDRVSLINFLTDSERTLLKNFSDGPTLTVPDVSIISLIEDQANRTPNSTALIFEGTELTYFELTRRSDSLAAYIVNQHKVAHSDLVGVYLTRSDWMIVAILAVLKAGAAYVPLDRKYPIERIEFITSDASITLIIDDSLLARFQSTPYESASFASSARPDALLYVMYTSGTTGNPKGVMIENPGVVNRVSWAKNFYGLDSTDVVLHKASIGFDASIAEIFSTLISGSKLVITKEDGVKDPDYLITLIRKHKITTIMLAPSLLEILTATGTVKDFESIKRIVCGGEQLTEAHVAAARHLFPLSSFHNLYGPTETTIDVACWTASHDGEQVSLGRPGTNCRIYILSPEMIPCHTGVLGEICIGGIQLARGYLNNPVLTQSSFVPDPFLHKQKIYRTGDYGKWLKDGNIFFVGRNDDQIKIRGHRIELGEIQKALLSQSGVESASVVVHSSPNGQNKLVAYLVTRKALDDIRKSLTRTLPSYMIPDHFECLDSMPLTVNGKVDKDYLPVPLQSTSGVVAVLPRNDTERNLAMAWTTVLERQSIDVNDNFFAIGGNSIRAIRLQALLRREYKMPFSVPDIYNLQTIARMALKSKAQNVVILNEDRSNAGRNIYFLPPIFGSPILFQPLSQRLCRAFNSYGFAYPGLFDDQTAFDSIASMAKHFAEWILSNQRGETEFLVIGYSMGAKVAFEIVKLLELELRPELIIVDGSPEALISDESSIEFELDDLVEKHSQLIRDADLEGPVLRNYLRHNLKLSDRHKPNSRISTHIHYMEATRERPRRKSLWDALTSGGVTVTECPTNHWEMFSESNLKCHCDLVASIFSKEVNIEVS